MPPKKRQPKREAGAKQIVNVSVKVGGEAKKPKRKRAKRAKKVKASGDIAQPGATGVEYLGLKTIPPPSYPLLPPATYELPKQFQALPPPPQIAGLIEDVKKERQNLLEDIQREVKSTAIKEVQRAQGAEQRAELERAGFQEPVPLPKLLDKAQEPIQTFEDIKKGEPVVQEPEEEQALPFQGEAFLGIEEIKRKGRKQGIKNRPKEQIEAERKAKEEQKLQKKMDKALKQYSKKSSPQRKSKIPTLDIEQQRIIPIQTQREFNLIPNLATMPTGLPF